MSAVPTSTWSQREQADSTYTSTIRHSAADLLPNPGSDAATAQYSAIEPRRDLFGNR